MLFRSLKRKARAGGVVYGTMLSTSRNPRWAAPVGALGLDYVIIDTEHSPRGRADVSDFLAALGGAGVVPIIRIPIPASHYVTHAPHVGAQATGSAAGKPINRSAAPGAMTAETAERRRSPISRRRSRRCGWPRRCGCTGRT